MTIVEFYQKLTEIMENYESKDNDLKESRKYLKDLISEAENSGLKNINVTSDILDNVEQKTESSYRGSSYC